MAWRTPLKLWRKLRPRAKEMRNEPTPAEAWLREALQHKKVLGLKFRRLFPIDRFVTDFACPHARLIIEVDGPIHDQQQEADAVRQEHLEKLGFQVFRLPNEKILQDRASAVRKIARIAQARLEAVKPYGQPPIRRT